MNMKLNIRRLLGGVRSDSNCRYVEVDGLRYAVGMGYIVELTKKYNERYGTDEAIDTVLASCFGNTRMTTEAIEKMALGVETALNFYAQRAGVEAYPNGYFERLVEDRGFGYIGKVVFTIASTLTVMLTAGAGEEKDEAQAKEEKKSTP